MNNVLARWLVPSVTLLVLLIVALAVESKPEEALGLFTYQQLLVVLGLVVVLLLSVVIALLPPARRRNVAINATLVTVSSALTLAMVEVVLFVIPVKHQMDNPWYLHVQDGLAQVDDLPFGRPAHLEWQGMSRGDLALLYGEEDPWQREVAFHTDMDGFRNHRDLPQADVVIIGDSFTEAGNTPEAETYGYLLGEKLGVSLRNLGRSGYTSPSELIVLERQGLATKPRRVIWQVAESNDLLEATAFRLWVASGRTALFGKAMLGYPAWQHRSPTLKLYQLLSSKPEPLGGRFEDAQGKRHEIRFLMLPGAQQTPNDHGGWSVMVEAFREGQDLCRENGIELTMLFIPMKFHVMGPRTEFNARTKREVGSTPALSEAERLPASLRPLCEELGIRFIDATEVLRARAAAGEIVYLPFDTHLSPLGHRIVAELMAEALGPSEP